MNTFTFTTFKWDSQSKDLGHSPCLEGGNWVSACVFQVKLIQEQSPFDGRCPVTCHPFLLHLLGWTGPLRAPGPHPALPVECHGHRRRARSGGPLCWALKGSLHEQGVEQGSEKMRSQAGSQGAESDSCNPSVPSLLLSAGDLGAPGLPRVAAAHHRPAGVRAHLPSPVSRGGRARGGLRAGSEGAGRRLHAAPSAPQGELQRVLPAVPRHALGGRHLLSRRFGRGLGARALEPGGPRSGGLSSAGLAVPSPAPGAAALCGLVYLFARLRYFQGYARSAQQR